jgi:hypothetical protein
LPLPEELLRLGFEPNTSVMKTSQHINLVIAPRTM